MADTKGGFTYRVTFGREPKGSDERGYRLTALDRAVCRALRHIYKQEWREAGQAIVDGHVDPMPVKLFAWTWLEDV